MSTPIQTFFLEPTDRVRLFLRRFAGSIKNDEHYHNAIVVVGEADAIMTTREGRESASLGVRPETFDGDERWPTKCDCGHVFLDSDLKQVAQDLIYRRVDTGELLTLVDAPDGASWYADWMLSPGSNHWRGPDGHCLVVRTPKRHDWMVDSTCSNCPMPDDKVHRCWCRKGDPRLANVTVSKEPGPGETTCNAGGGSIQTTNWHGFLRDGKLLEC